MIEWLKNWLLRDEIKTLNECVIKWQQSLKKWRERAQSSERDVMEARQVARYWREQAGKGDSLSADDLFPWEVRVMKSYGISVVKRDEAKS